MVEDKSMSEFERLLQERAQIQQWLERLSDAGDKTPESVRERVQADYQKRLTEVQEELNGHRDEIGAALAKHNEVRDELLGQQKDAEEKRAEAELRNTVGEFDDARWEELRTELDGALNKIGEELSAVDEEISKLDKAMVSLKHAPGDELDDVAIPEDIPPAEAIAEIPDEEPSDEQVVEDEKMTADVESLEELTFLQTAPEGDDSESEVVSPTAEPMPPDAAETLGKPTASGKQPSVEVGAEETTTFADSVEQPKKGAAKTLKCTECGTMNLPTEWYCERCGAELAAL